MMGWSYSREIWRHEVVDAARPDFQAGFGEGALGRHLGTEARVGIAPGRRISLDFGAAETSAAKGVRAAGVGDDAARVVVESPPSRAARA